MVRRSAMRRLLRAGIVRVAVVDQGTNTTRLLLAEVENGRLAATRRFTEVTRLGQGVDERRHLDPAAAQRVRGVIAGFAAEIAAFDPARRLLFATSALRDAGGGRRFLDELRTEFGLPWRVLEGEEEAALAFRGGVSGTDLTSTVVVIDIGGGSTEFAVGDAAVAAPSWSCSVDVGAVRLTERFLHDDPPRDDQWSAAEAFVKATLSAAVPAEVRGAAGAALGVAGTYTTLVAYKLKLREYDPALVHGHVLSLAEMQAAQVTFRRMSSARRGALTGIQPGREDVILAGTLLAVEACRLFGLAAVHVSEADILDGAALWLAEQP